VKNYANIFLFLAGLFLFTSCDIVDEEYSAASYGLPNYELRIDSEDYAIFDANEFSNLYISGKISVNGKEFSVRIRHQGNTTRGMFKKNYLVEFETQDPTFQCKSVILSGQQKDRSMLRAVLSYYLFSEAGLKTSAIKPVTLYINGTSHGLYYLIEPVNEEFFIKRGSSTGELYSAINTLADFSFKNNSEIRDGFKKRIPDDDNFYTLEQLILLLDNGSVEKIKTEVDKYWNVDAYLRYMAVSMLICNHDGIFHNYYINREQTSQQYEIVPWDLDLTFGTETVICAFPGTGNMMDKLMQIPEYRQLYKKYLSCYVNGCFSNANMMKKIEEMKQLITDAYANDPWFESNSDDLNAEAETLKSYVIQRNEYLRGQLASFN
jgi:spore coat protein H